MTGDEPREAPAAVVILDGQGTVIAWSDAAESSLGWSEADALGRPVNALVPVVGGGALFPENTGATDGSSRLVLRRRDGSRLAATCTLLRLRPGAASAAAIALVIDPETAHEQWLTALLYRGKDVAFVVDPDGTILFVADVADPPLGYRPSEAVGRSALQFVHDDDRDRARQVLAAALASTTSPPSVQIRGRAADGTWRRVEVTVTNLLANPAVGGLVVNMRDVSESYAMQQALRESEARYRSIVETAQEGIWLLREDGQTLFANRSLAQILDRDYDDVTRLNVFDVIAVDAQEEARRRLGGREHAGHEVYEFPFLRGDGESRWASVSATPLFVDGVYSGSLLMISDITDRKHAEAELERRALYDDLTGLPNRTLLQDRLRQAVRRRDATGGLAVFFIDLDDFKAVNDSYGHETGDELLREVGTRLSRVVREGDTLARFAGDEFVMVCPDVEGEIEADALALRMLREITQPIQVQSYLITINASIGVALHEAPRDGAQLIRDADLAMLDAKKHGRGRHVMFDPHAARHSRYHLEDVQQLRQALDQSQVEVFFQPQVDLVDGGICSVEALARWRHPQRGLLEPSSFIGLAEASGLIIRLGALVLEAACAQAGEWLRAKHTAMPVAVNISARQLDDEHLPATVRRALERANLPPELLSLEITETAVMSDTDRAERVLRELHDAGIHLAIDDFGTGYSSLLHLKRLPVDEIKIDRTFVDGVDQQGDDQSIVAAVINMASALDLRIVGEGVETAAQAEALVAMGCRVAQGYLYGAPMDATRISARIDEA